MSAWRAVWLVLSKDVVAELRTREVVATMTLFALLMAVVFAFAFSVDETRARLVAPGIVWLVLLFASTLGLNRVFDRERDHGCLTGLLLSPAGPVAVYVAKVLGVVLFTLLTEILTVPLMFIFLGIGVPLEGLGLFVSALVLGTIGLALIGTLFGGMLANARLREVLLPLVVYPVVIPVVIAGVEVTSIALGGGIPSSAGGWLRLMVGFDLIFGVVAPWVFGKVMLD
ncbi:MAG: heme exporter protein CcmB [Myxococcota bacterium]